MWQQSLWHSEQVYVWRSRWQSWHRELGLPGNSDPEPLTCFWKRTTYNKLKQSKGINDTVSTKYSKSLANEQMTANIPASRFKPYTQLKWSTVHLIISCHEGDWNVNKVTGGWLSVLGDLSLDTLVVREHWHWFTYPVSGPAGFCRASDDGSPLLSNPWLRDLRRSAFTAASLTMRLVPGLTSCSWHLFSSDGKRLCHCTEGDGELTITEMWLLVDLQNMYTQLL